MSVEMYFELGLDCAECILKKLESNGYTVQSIANPEATGAFVIRNSKIIATFSKMSKMSIGFRNEDYNVSVGYFLSFNYNSSDGVNSGDNIISFVLNILKMFVGDCLLIPNGNEPIIIRRDRIVEISPMFEQYFNDKYISLIK